MGATRSCRGARPACLPCSCISCKARWSICWVLRRRSAFYFGEWEEGGAIAAVLALNSLIGFLTELKAARSIEALRALGTRSARVRRDGHTRLVPADEMVPGDIVVLEAGDSVSADLRLIEASGLAADESTLTGESVAVDKSTDPVPRDARLGDRHSMLFKGTAVTRGSGMGVVVATGLQTELGRVSQLVEEAAPGSSPLEKKLARLSGQLVWATVTLAAPDRRRRLADRQGHLPHGRGGDRACGRGDPGRPADRGDAGARPRHVAHGPAECADRAAVRGRDAGRDHRHSHRQDRHPDREPHDGPPLLAAIGRNRSRTAAGGRIRLGDDPQLDRLLEIAVLCNNATLGRTAGDDSGDPMELALLRAGRLAGLERSALLQAQPDGRQARLRHRHQDDGDRAPSRRTVSFRGQGRARSRARQGAEDRLRRRRHRHGRRDAGGMAQARRAPRPSRAARAGLRRQMERRGGCPAVRGPDIRRASSAWRTPRAPTCRTPYRPASKPAFG